MALVKIKYKIKEKEIREKCLSDRGAVMWRASEVRSVGQRGGGVVSLC